jgi:hypothetical protein
MIRVPSHILISCQALCQALADDDPMPSHAGGVDIPSALAGLAHMQGCLEVLIQERSGGGAREQTRALSATHRLLALVREAVSVEVAEGETGDHLVGDGADVLVMVTREPGDISDAGREGAR